ncbi:MAG: hypothetical protein HFF70_04975 [Oscillospiraceae bacterium]|jgi:hypothetical protein|nr:hypothetical protein [Oscillospiraceae bacterium]
MTKDDWLELTVLERKKYNYLVELQDLTGQLAENLDRNDQVSVRMLVAMRQDPVRLLAEVDNSGKIRLAALSEEDRRRAGELLKEGQPRDDGERIFLEQAQKTRRLLEQVVAMDRRVSMKMAGENSFYHK